jgi:hypothetical protein
VHKKTMPARATSERRDAKLHVERRSKKHPL